MEIVVNKKKTCLELASSPGVTKSICEAVSTSDFSKKKCEIKSDKSGCQEVDISQENPKTSSGSSASEQSSSENMKSKMLFAFLCLFLF